MFFTSCTLLCSQFSLGREVTPFTVTCLKFACSINSFQQQINTNSCNPKVWRSLDLEPNSKPPLFKTRSSSMPIPGSKKLMDSGKTVLSVVRSGRGSVSNENNVLLDPEVLTDYPTQAFVLTVLVRSFQGQASRSGKVMSRSCIVKVVKGLMPHGSGSQNSFLYLIIV